MYGRQFVKTHSTNYKGLQICENTTTMSSSLFIIMATCDWILENLASAHNYKALELLIYIILKYFVLEMNNLPQFCS